MKKFILVLGFGRSVKRLFDVIEREFSEHTPVYCTYGKRLEFFEKNAFCFLKNGEEETRIRTVVDGKGKVVGVVNLTDSYIDLHGKLVDIFKVPGPSFSAVSLVKNKAKLFRLMVENGLADFHPKSVVIELNEVEHEIERFGYPCVLKPVVGSKSRGVFVIRSSNGLQRALKRLNKHFSQITIRRNLEAKNVLLQEYVTGQQVAPVSYVDAEGELRIIAEVDVLCGTDVGQQHMQCVYRTTPSVLDKAMMQQIQQLLQQIVKAAGLRSTLLDPELMISGRGLKLMEINARLGGYRTELFKPAYGIDLEKMVVQLALGEELDIDLKKKESCTAVEVWEEKSGRLLEFSFPNQDQVYHYEQLIQKGEEYLVPPEGDVPIASFYVLAQSDSLKKAQEIRRTISTSIS